MLQNKMRGRWLPPTLERVLSLWLVVTFIMVLLTPLLLQIRGSLMQADAGHGRSLGIIARIASGDSTSSPKAAQNDVHGKVAVNPVIRRYFLQSLARELMPKERVSRCHRHRAPLRVVSVWKNTETKKAYFQGLEVCSSVWMCPVCAGKISEGRRQELTAALVQAALTEDDGSKTVLVPILVTYTARHNKSARLAPFLDDLIEVYRAFKSGRWFQELKEEYAWVGSVRALEVTYTDKNGWHPHIHEIVLLRLPLSVAAADGLANSLKVKWAAKLASRGRSADWEHGVNVRLGDADVFEYIAKFGHEPQESTWTIAHELTKSVVKTSVFGGRTPIELLADYGEGDITAGKLWQEYARAFKGRNQLVWSRGLRDLLGIGDEKTDGDLSEDKQSVVDVRLAQFDADQWRCILRADLRGELLTKASKLDDLEFSEWLRGVFDKWLPIILQEAADRAGRAAKNG